MYIATRSDLVRFLQMLADRTALLDGVGHEVLGLLVAAEIRADQADRLGQAVFVGGVSSPRSG